MGHTSSHNSDQDAKDEALWEEFCTRVALIAREHRYSSLDLEFFGAATEGVWQR